MTRKPFKDMRPTSVLHTPSGERFAIRLMRMNPNGPMVSVRMPLDTINVMTPGGQEATRKP